MKVQAAEVAVLNETGEKTGTATLDLKSAGDSAKGLVHRYVVHVLRNQVRTKEDVVTVRATKYRTLSPRSYAMTFCFLANFLFSFFFFEQPTALVFSAKVLRALSRGERLEEVAGSHMRRKGQEMQDVVPRGPRSYLVVAPSSDPNPKTGVRK